MPSAKTSKTKTHQQQSSPDNHSSDAKNQHQKLKQIQKKRKKSEHKCITVLAHSSKDNVTMKNNPSSTQTTFKHLKKSIPQEKMYLKK